MVLAATLLALLLADAAQPAAPAATPAPSRTLVGEILSIDLPNRRVVVAQGLKAGGKSGASRRETVTVHVPFSTPLRRGHRATSLGDLKPRDQAVVRYRVTSAGAQAFSLTVADLAGGAPEPIAGGS